MDEDLNRHPFEGLEKLYGPEALTKLAAAHVCIVGLGGVGSWAAEALARSGIGKLTLVDLDEACISNINRQIHTLTHTIGHPKITLMAERIYAINPHCQVNLIEDFLTAENAQTILSQGYDFVFDAIDRITLKCVIISYCYHHHIPVITAGAAGGLLNPYSLTITDLNHTVQDRLLFFIRKKLKQRFNLPKNNRQPWGIPVVYSPLHSPQTLVAPGCTPSGLNCAGSLGSACFVTGSMGFFAASYILNHLVTPKPHQDG